MAGAAVGLTNLARSCFINAGLQNLVSVEDLKNDLGWVGILVGLYFLMLWDSRVGGCYVYTLDTTEP